MALPFIPDSSTLSRNISLIKPRWDSIVAPCSTMSIVISPYETINKTVSSGSRLIFLSAMGACGFTATSSSTVKVHPGSSPTWGLPDRMQLGHQWGYKLEVVEIRKVRGAKRRFQKYSQVQFDAHNGNQNWVTVATCRTAQKPRQSRIPVVLAHTDALALQTNMSEVLSSILLPTKKQLGNRRQLHIGCSLVDLANLGIAPVLFDWIVFGESVATVDFNRQRGHALGDLRSEQLGHRRFLHKVDTSILHARTVVDHKPCRFDLGCHLRDLELNGLEIRDCLAELLALLCVLRGKFPRAAGEANHLGANADAAFVQGFDGDLVTLARLAKYVVFRDAAVFEYQFAGR